MGWACTPTVIYNAFRLQKRAKKSRKEDGGGAQASVDSLLSLSRSLSTDDSGSENNGSVFNQEDDMQFLIEEMDQREQRCPCGCPGIQCHEGRDLIKIRTKEYITRPNAAFSAGSAPPTEAVDRIFNAGVLRFQGRHHCVEEIAPVWKKDCRKWLWKGARNAKSKQSVSERERRDDAMV